MTDVVNPPVTKRLLRARGLLRGEIGLERIRLTSASTLPGTADPVRTFQQFAMADLVSEGRVEIIF